MRLTGFGGSHLFWGAAFVCLLLLAAAPGLSAGELPNATGPLPVQVPEPATLALMAAGLGGLIFEARRRKKKDC